MAQAIGRSEAKKLEIEPWNLLADQRAREIDSGADISFRHVLAPTLSYVLESQTKKGSRLIDIGCGTGRLFPYLAGTSNDITAIDPSTRSVELARKFAVSSSVRVRSSVDTIQSFAAANHQTFDVAVANMVLMDVVDLADFVRHTRRVLRPGALFIASVTHPYFWPSYWGYEGEQWFDYRQETFIRSKFKTSLSASPIDTLHVHRPLAEYASRFADEGFTIQSLIEPVLPERIQRETGVFWKTPHFLLFAASVAT